MLSDGIQLLGTSTATNFTIESGPTFPATGNTRGELFYQTGVGLHVYDGTDWVSIGGAEAVPQLHVVNAFYPGIPTASVKVLYVPITEAITFPANFAGSYFKASANATGSTAFDVQKNGSSIGTVTIGAGSTTATFVTSGGASQSFAAGDLLAIIAPGTADATLADPSFALRATRT